jgi:spore coat protein U domain-containing protein, fimbrial subunit CupE1/2/3/6
MRFSVVIALVFATSALANPFIAQAACSLTSTSIVFGNYDIFSPSPLDTLGQIIFRCGNNDHNVSISLDRGGEATFNPRRMLNGTSSINYNLYLDAARTIIWGDGTNGTQNFFVRNPQPNNRDISVPIYGRIPAGQGPSVGNYSNTLTVTINF